MLGNIISQDSIIQNLFFKLGFLWLEEINSQYHNKYLTFSQNLEYVTAF
jgi:hypothetical protein